MGLFSKADKNSDEEKPLESYKVNYRGGLAEYPKSRSGAIDFKVYEDRFEFKPTMGSKWFQGLVIPYGNVAGLKIAERQVSFAEGMLGGLDSRQLNQANNIHIAFVDGDKKAILRVEMLTGVTVMGQAKKCKEFEDRLLTYGIRDKFRKAKSNAQSETQNSDIVVRLKELNTLKQQGVITEEEFNKAKQQLLG